ncbi:forkhead box protein M1 [Aplochiton taeniatus]
MRESPRRPLILKRRKLPFQRNDSSTVASQNEQDKPRSTEASKPPSNQCFPDGIRIMDHPTMPSTQVVVIPKTADLQSVIDALTAKGKQCGPEGPNKFILLSGSIDDESLCQTNFDGDCSIRSNVGLVTEPEITPSAASLTDSKTMTTIKPLNKELDCSPLDDSLTNIQWLGRMSTDGLGPDSAKGEANKENLGAAPQFLQVHTGQMDVQTIIKDPLSERPPYSYMAMIQFAINSKRNRRMTLKEIYSWIEDHFPYFREVAKPGWKNSIRHNLSLHDMFIRETTPDGKVSYWTIRPEANRCLTLDQPGLDPSISPFPLPVQFFDQQQHKRMVPLAQKTAIGYERRMKPLLPRTDSYLVPIQLPFTSSVYLPSSSTSLPQPGPQRTLNSTRGSKRVRIAPKLSQGSVSTVAYPCVKEDPKVGHLALPLCPVTPRAAPSSTQTEAHSSRRKQRLVLPSHEEPVLFFPNSTFFDSGLASDASTFQDTQDTDLEPRTDADSPGREYSFKTPIKSGSSQPASSTPSKPRTVLPEPWKVTPVGKESRAVLDFSPIRTPRGPAFTPQRHDYTPFSFNSTPFKDLPLFNSPRELLTSGRSGATGPTDSPGAERLPGCSRELQVGGTPIANRSLTEGLVLDTMNDSLSKILVDISFSGLEDDDLGMANISWSQLIPELK